MVFAALLQETVLQLLLKKAPSFSTSYFRDFGGIFFSSLFCEEEDVLDLAKDVPDNPYMFLPSVSVHKA